MPRVPQYGDTQVATRPLPSVAANAGGNAAEAFSGSDREVARAGAAVARTGGQLVDIATATQEVRNADMLLRAQSSYDTEETKFLESMKQRRGADAVGVTEDGRKWFDEESKKQLDSLENDAQRRVFQAHLLKRGPVFTDAVVSYEAQQQRQSAADSANAVIMSSISAAAANYHDPEAVAIHKGKIQKSVEAMALMEGWTPEIKKEKMDEAITAFHQRIIEAQVDKDPKAAREYYNAHKKEIKGDARDNIEKLLRTAGVKEQARTYEDEIMSKALPEKDALALARKKTKNENVEVQDELVLRIGRRYAEARDLKRQDEQDAGSDAWKTLINAKGDLDSIPSQLWDRLSGDDQRALVDYVRARNVADRPEDDWTMLDKVDKQIEDGDITDTSQLLRYEPYFTRSTFRALRTKVEKRGTVSVTDMRQAFEDRIGKSRAKWSDADRQQWIKYQDYILRNVKETRRPEDLDIWADKWFMEGKGLEDRYFRNDPDTLGEAITKGRKDFVIDTPEDVKQQVDDTLFLIRKSGGALPEGMSTDQARDLLYTQHYFDAQRYFAAHETEITPARAAAYSILRANKKPITMQNIDYVVGQLNASQP